MADSNSRSVSACLRCRRQKVKCDGPSNNPCQKCKSSGAECQFVQPRAITRTTSAIVPTDQPDCFSRLEGQIAHLTSVVEALRNDLSHSTGSRAREPRHHAGQPVQPAETTPMQIDPPLPFDPEWSSFSPQTDIITRGIVSEEEYAELFETFLGRCNDTIAILDSVPDSPELVRRDPILLAAVCAIGARASPDKNAVYRTCMTEAVSLISRITFGPQPNLMALRGIVLISAWHRSDRLWGMVLTLAYEMGLHKDALRLPQSADQMKQAEIERARTWLSIFCFELMAKTYRPYLIQDTEQYIDLTQDLLRSPFSRPVDQRILAYLQLLKIVVEARKQSLSELSTVAQEAQLISMNEALDTWFHRVHNSIDPLYQTFSKPQDRNRLIIPYAFTRLYINGLALDHGILNGNAGSTADFAKGAIAAAIDAAFLLLSTAFESRALAQSLYYTIDYSSNTLTAALSFLHRVVSIRMESGIDIDAHAVLALFEQARGAFELAGARSYVDWTTGLMEQIAAIAYQ